MKNLQINQDTIGPQEYPLVEKNGGGVSIYEKVITYKIRYIRLYLDGAPATLSDSNGDIYGTNGEFTSRFSIEDESFDRNNYYNYSNENLHEYPVSTGLNWLDNFYSTDNLIFYYIRISNPIIILRFQLPHFGEGIVTEFKRSGFNYSNFAPYIKNLETQENFKMYDHLQGIPEVTLSTPDEEGYNTFSVNFRSN